MKEPILPKTILFEALLVAYPLSDKHYGNKK
jgi:hypothetical protein